VVVEGFVYVLVMIDVIANVKEDGRAVDCGVSDVDYDGEVCLDCRLFPFPYVFGLAVLLTKACCCSWGSGQNDSNGLFPLRAEDPNASWVDTASVVLVDDVKIAILLGFDLDL